MKIVINSMFENKLSNKKCISITIVISSMFWKFFMSNSVWSLKKEFIFLWIFIESTIFASFLFSLRIFAFFEMLAKIFSKSKTLAFIFAILLNKTKWFFSNIISFLWSKKNASTWMTTFSLSVSKITLISLFNKLQLSDEMSKKNALSFIKITLSASSMLIKIYNI